MLHKLLVQVRLHIRNRKLDVLGPNVETKFGVECGGFDSSSDNLRPESGFQ